MRASLDIVIPIHNALEFLTSCINTVYEYTKDFRLIMVDDCSDQATKAYIQEVLHRDPTSVLVQTSRQKWFTRASNLGFRMVRTERCVLLNSDCVVNAGWLQELQEIWADVESKGMKVGLVGHWGNPGAGERYVTTNDPNYVTGHCWLANMEAFRHAASARGTPNDIFNERDAYQVHINSDRIFCHELNKIGYTTAVSFHAAIGHHGGKSWSYDLESVARAVPTLGVID